MRIHELRPLTLEEALQLAEFNSPQLKAAASQVDQAKSALRAAIAAWYPTVDLLRPVVCPNISSFLLLPKSRFRIRQRDRQWWIQRVSGGSMVSLQVSWDLINPAEFLRSLRLGIVLSEPATPT